MKASELRTWWVVEWHPLGAVTVAPLMDVLHRNHGCALAGRDEKKLVLGLFPSFESAQDGAKRVKGEIRGERLKAEMGKAEMGSGQEAGKANGQEQMANGQGGTA
jgi:hypothetical protein